MKDNFSAQAEAYANFRPHYPTEMYAFIYGQLSCYDRALDIATGNGQVAKELAAKFSQVYATDISAKQLSEAPQLPNIQYKQEAAEQSSFADHFFDLVTVAQAIHWFNFDLFYANVRRITKPGGIIAVAGYGLVSVNTVTDRWLQHFYTNIIGPYWDSERKYIDDHYTTIPFPFEEISAPSLFIRYKWSKQQFLGYLNTWSAVQHFIRANSVNPLAGDTLQRLDAIWPDNTSYDISFPLLLRVGRL